MIPASRWVGIKTFSDYVPILSTVTAVIDLKNKFFITEQQRQAPLANHYYAYLNQCSSTRLITLLVPVIGNIIVAFYDMVSNQAANPWPTERWNAYQEVKEGESRALIQDENGEWQFNRNDFEPYFDNPHGSDPTVWSAFVVAAIERDWKVATVLPCGRESLARAVQLAWEGNEISFGESTDEEEYKAQASDFNTYAMSAYVKLRCRQQLRSINCFSFWEPRDEPSFLEEERSSREFVLAAGRCMPLAGIGRYMVSQLKSDEEFCQELFDVTFDVDSFDGFKNDASYEAHIRTIYTDLEARYQQAQQNNTPRYPLYGQAMYKLLLRAEAVSYKLIEDRTIQINRLPVPFLGDPVRCRALVNNIVYRKDSEAAEQLYQRLEAQGSFVYENPPNDGTNYIVWKEIEPLLIQTIRPASEEENKTSA